MKRSNIAIAILFVTALIAPLAMAQSLDITEERRPFDFRDKYYGDNGVDPAKIVSRRNGLDQYSVFDYINSEIFRGVRILETRTAYDHDGNNIYWVFYGAVHKTGFTNNAAGDDAMDSASRVPVYFFPSVTVKDAQRQAALIDAREDNPEKNPLGLGIAVDVEFTRKAYTKEGLELVNRMIGKNGKSLDEMPLIKRASEIAGLARYGLVTQTVRSISQKGAPDFLLAEMISDPRMGAISPDAFLESTGTGGKVIDSEMIFVEEFECLQKSGRWCGQK